MEDRLTQVMKAIADDIMSIVKMMLESNHMINKKVGVNTIYGSSLYNDLKVIAKDDGDLVYDIMVNDYIQYIESGRRAGARFPPVEPIVRWAKKRGIPTDNSTIFLIRRAISRDGIRPRPIFQYIFEEMDNEWERNWSDEIFDKIMEIIDNFFK